MQKKSLGDIGCVVLAAGKGIRMKSELPKVLFEICGKSIIDYILETLFKIDFIKKIYIVVGYKAEDVKNHINSKFNKEKIIFVYQPEQLGSADALSKVQHVIDNNIKYLFVISGDVPLISCETIKNFCENHINSKYECSVLSVIMDNPYGYGRIIRDISKKFFYIVEETEANEIQKQIKEVNAGIYLFNTSILWKALSKIKPNNKKKEFYLTDVVKYINSKQTFLCKNQIETKGINTRKDLCEVEEFMRLKILENWMLNGVTIMLPNSVYIDAYSEISFDTKILPGSIIIKSKISRGCIIGPYTTIVRSEINKNTEIIYSYVSDSVIGNMCRIGPFSRIRPQTKIEDFVNIGNFVEIKNSFIDNYVKINHLSYIGDSEIGKEVNVGAGTITCNYDGIKKHKTYIGEKTFIGSNVNLIAPIKVGSKVIIAAGSTVTRDVPSCTFVISRPQEIQKKNHKLIKRLFGRS